MKYLFIFLFLTACANSKQETPAAVQPPPAQEAPTNVPTALGDKDLEAQIAEDFKPYLKYFSREKLYPYTVIKNGFVLSDTEKKRILSNLRIAVLF